ncbi:hypothetical protein ARTSIC4J27_3319 [Pseudarthrobacter siccitolerans]|uniref:Uncharacterized protein n=1 Tax=Pseudarthrobacter siccitolerans TaxID=861266 RepID=A0A024H5Q3_9MICC|nr:hypothetical protein ARTSIC4J27_3319 [Pseudarthrobacter siccitolerans]
MLFLAGAGGRHTFITAPPGATVKGALSAARAAKTTAILRPAETPE